MSCEQWAAVKDISVNAAIAAVLAEVEGIFILKEHKNSTEVFSRWTTVLYFTLSGFGKS